MADFYPILARAVAGLSETSPEARRAIYDRARAALREAADALQERNGVRLSEEQLRRSPHIWIGSLDSLVEKVLELRAELGITSFMTGDVDELAPLVERVAGT